MTEAVFVFNEDTRQWKYENIILYEIKGEWRMWWDKLQKDFESIYDGIDYIAKEFNLLALFKIPASMEDSPAKCG